MKMKKRIKRGITLLTASVLTMGLLVGCGSTKKEQDKEDGSGRYIEENITSSLEKGNENKGIGAVRKDGAVVYFSTNEEGNEVYQNTRNGDNWETKPADWLSAVIQDGSVVTNIASDKEGTVFALTIEMDGSVRVYRESEGKAVEIPISEVKGSRIAHFAITEDLDIVIQNSEGLVTIYSGTDGSIIREFAGGSFEKSATSLLSVEGKKLAVLNKDSDGIVIYEIESGKQLSELKPENELTEGAISLKEDGSVFYINKEGLQYIKAGSSTPEVLMEGSRGVMSDGLMEIQSFISVSKDEFYVSYRNHNTFDGEIYRYHYEKNASVNGNAKLVIYGLEENQTISQAVTLFKKKHSNIIVEYRTGNQDGAATKSDNIKVLNTELLSGNGADILVLDGLPFSSYIEKGILEDISDITGKLTEAGTLDSSIIAGYQDENKVYGVPVKFGIPIAYGNTEMSAALKSLDTLWKYLEANPQVKLMTGNADYEQVVKLLVNIYYNQLIKKDGKLETEHMQVLLECARKIYDGMEHGAVQTGQSMQGIGESDWNLGNTESTEALMQDNQVFTTEIKGILDLLVPYSVQEATGAATTVMDGKMVPHGVVGINSVSKQKELAKEFVKLLLSDEIQQMESYDGLPVNKKALELVKTDFFKLIGNSASGSSTEGSAADNDPGNFRVVYPDEKYVNDILNQKEMPQLIQIDDVIQEMIVNEAKSFFDGAVTAQEAARAIANKTDTYLAE